MNAVGDEVRGVFDIERLSMAIDWARACITRARKDPSAREPLHDFDHGLLCQECREYFHARVDEMHGMHCQLRDDAR